MCNIKQAVDQWEPGHPPGVFRLLEQPPLFVFPLWLQQTCEYGGHNTFLCEEDGPWVTKELKAIMKKEKWVWHNYEYKMEEKFSYIKLLSAWRGEWLLWSPLSKATLTTSWQHPITSPKPPPLLLLQIWNLWLHPAGWNHNPGDPPSPWTWLGFF